MATSQTSSSKKTTSKVAASIKAKKAPGKKATENPAKKASSAKAANLLPAASKSVQASMAKKAVSNKGVGKVSVSPEKRYKMIEAAAYLRAERRSFASGHALDDWIAAEAEIDAMLKA